MEKIRSAIFRFGTMRISRTAVVGGLASLVDFMVLITLVRGAGLSPQAANIPSLIAGTSVQFFGNRHFVFQAAHGHLGKQLTGFVAAEVVALTLNAAIYYALVTWTPINFAAARPLGTFLVFTLFSYPVWSLVFRHKQR